MKLLLGAFVLLVLFALALSIFKFVIVKLFVLSIWVALIALLIYVASNLLKKA
jgi:hypothetical protein